MRCNDFDIHIDEMLSGILHPDANQHMQQCERCASHLRARATVQHGLRQLAAASAQGPSRATDRAVMESYRRLQERRPEVRGLALVSTPEESTARLFTFPSRSLAPVWTSRTWWSGAAAAAVVFAVLGSAVHLWIGVPSVNTPMGDTAPGGTGSQQSASASSPGHSLVASNGAGSWAPRHSTPRPASLPVQPSAPLSNQTVASQFAASQGSVSQTNASQTEVASAGVLPAAPTSTRPAIAYGETASYESAPVTQLSPNAAPIIRLASSGAVNNMAQSASSTWPGYSNLMYCDAVVCSGPMQVVHIKVPVGQVKPNLGQTVGNSFVNAEVVIGPDGVARAIRVAN
jgi:hypothetical protein